MRENLAETLEWLQMILTPVRDRYSGLLCAQQPQARFKSGRLDFDWYDIVSPFFSLMPPDAVRNTREIDAFVQEARRVQERYPSMQNILLNNEGACIHT